MTEIYKALYDYETDKEDELSLKEGEIIKITNKDSPDWWLAERLNNSKEYGLIPSNFIELVSTTPKGEKKLAIVIQDYEAQDPEEISLQKDRIITVLDQNFAEGWWKGDSNGKIGVFPADHVEFVKDNEHAIEAESKAKKDPFKLAAYGVKQGGIGSILAGGFSLKRSSTTGNTNRQSVNERPPSTNTPSTAPVIPTNKPTASTVKNTQPEAKKSKKAMVIHEYVPENDDEIPLLKGEYVTIVDQLEDDGWWKGTNENHVTGIFPSNFVQILENETPPPRPTRTRPATVKTESSDQMARPPPVPVNTRPTSLLSNRPVTSPPPKPTTSPPIPTKRSNSIMSPSPVNTHRRIPSIPLVSPDLPPVSPVSSRHSRPPSTNAPDIPPPVIPARAKNEAIQNMAKPPKVNFKPVVNRPQSNNNVDTPPDIPKRTMPPRPSSTTTVETPKDIEPKQQQETARRSINSTEEPVVPKRPSHPSTALPSVPNIKEEEDDDMTVLVRRLVQAEVNKIRKEFETKLEDERIERLKIQVELEELKASLQEE